jgi:hypothetical protein
MRVSYGIALDLLDIAFHLRRLFRGIAVLKKEPDEWANEDVFREPKLEELVWRCSLQSSLPENQ